MKEKCFLFPTQKECPGLHGQVLLGPPFDGRRNRTRGPQLNRTIVFDFARDYSKHEVPAPLGPNERMDSMIALTFLQQRSSVNVANLYYS
jgi:hypothetical protein